MIPKEQATSNSLGFGVHIVLYAKGWYGRSDNTLFDLKVLLAEWTGWDVKDIRRHEILDTVIRAFLDCVNTGKSGMENVIMEMIGERWGRRGRTLLQDRKPLDVMLGQLSICTREYCFLDEVFTNINFGIMSEGAIKNHERVKTMNMSVKSMKTNQVATK